MKVDEAAYTQYTDAMKTMKAPQTNTPKASTEQGCPEKIDRVTVPELDDILGVAMPVLDDGFVRLVDYMGSDRAIVQAARVSYGAGTKKVHEDRGLIRYLMRNSHTTPLEMCELKLHVRVPMDHWRQWIRHRTANVNEYSTRYSVAIDACQHTEPHEWRLQAEGNRQGSDGHLAVDQGALLTEAEVELQAHARRVYNDRLSKGVAREQARKDLPLSTYTEAYWKVDLHNLLHFLALRSDGHAQKEIRAYADVIGERIVSKWCPLAWEAFLDYRVHALRLTRLEIEILTLLLVGSPSGDEKAIAVARSFGWLADAGARPIKNRERDEFEAKLTRLGRKAPWRNQ